ncbi:uroporphyrinogen-III synthase [Leucobacter sp. USHLN153]|uniref:uroporphyrinogen-III synthase n=1 Tax=Leucobacter sp. USHLN153 TaxID=3081268 RepID=UPI003017E27E
MTLPLDGVRVLVTRGGAAGERDAAEVRRRGGAPILAPLTEIVPSERPELLREAAEGWNRGDFDWLLMTSANAVDAFVAAGGRGPTGSQRVAAVGPATAEALRGHGMDPDLVPAADYSAVGLGAAILDRFATASRATGASAGSVRALLPVSEIADHTLEFALSEGGHEVTRVTAYRTVPAPRDAQIEDRVTAGEVDVILVLSGSAAREVARRFAPFTRSRPLLAAIGGPSARALATHELAADVVADPHTVSNLLDRVANALERTPLSPGGTA